MNGQDPGVAVTARGKRAITLEGDVNSVTAMIGRIRDDGQLVPVASRQVDLPGGLVRVDVDLATVRPERATAAPRRLVSVEFCLRAGMVILGSGILITAAWGVAVMLTWLWAQILIYGPAIVTLALIAVLMWWAIRPGRVEPRRGLWNWISGDDRTRTEQSTRREQPARRSLWNWPSDDDRPSPERSVRAENPARRTFWNWLSDDDRRVAAAPKPRGVCLGGFDSNTERWLRNLRDPTHRQTTEVYFGAKRARCALGWLFDPRHTMGRNFRDARGRYGRRLVDEVHRQNQAGVPLPKIADHIERELSKRGKR